VPVLVVISLKTHSKLAASCPAILLTVGVVAVALGAGQMLDVAGRGRYGEG